MTSDSPALYLAAARAVRDVVDRGHSLDDALAARGAERCRRRAVLQEICYGACRHYHYFDSLLAVLLRRPIKQRDRLVHFILINACYQLEYMRTPPHAVLDSSVQSVAGTRFSWAGGTINGVLRNFLARRAEIEQEIPPTARYSFPPWLYREIRAHWPDHYPLILESSNRKPPLTLRVNRRKTSRAAYLELLAEAAVAATPTEHSEVGVTLATPTPVARIPGFADGWVSVQDESAQLAEVVVGLHPGERVLDGCAAPGGKTCLLLESGACNPAAKAATALVALDLPDRIAAVEQNLARLGLQAEVVAADLTRAETWWDGRPFDRILLDVPCSGSGVIRRHPDIKHRRRPEDIAKFARQQLDLLSQAWPLLRPGGTLAYMTCSILPAENDAVIAQFLARQRNAKPQPLAAPPAVATEFGRQRLPGVHSGDGFYYCRLGNTQQPVSADSP